MSEPGILPEPIPFGKYYLLERVNVGGMAEIYKAKAFGVEGFERLLAIKQILENIARDESFINMFIDEAKIAGQLTHPNIAQIFDLGQAEGSYFIALEYISGKDLKTIFERARRIGEKVSIPRICYIMMKVCEGLGYAHEKKDPQGSPLNIVHRDISPQNILLSYEGEVKIIDFGIAKAQGKTSQTQAGMLKGKFSYMSPEQVRGIHVDHRSDIFSLGIVLYELLTLERLFLGESDFEIMRKIRHVEMSPPTLYNPHVPTELENIVLKALAPNSGDRYSSAYELAEDLEKFMRSQGHYYTNKDLASHMKESFQADIEFENKKLEYYRSLNLKPIEEQKNSGPAAPVGADLSWDDDEMETQIFDRSDAEDLAIAESITESDIVYAEDLTIQSGESHSSHDVTGIHIPDGGGADPEAATVEYDRWDANLDLAPPPRNKRAFEVEPRQRVQPTAQMEAIERRPVPQVTVPNAAIPGPSAAREKKGGARIGVILLVAFLVVASGLSYVYLTRDTTSMVTFAFGDEPVRILVNGAVIYEGMTPHEVSLPAGQARVTVEREGYQPFEETARFGAGEIVTLSAELEALNYSNTGIDLRTRPEGATVLLNGEVQEGTTPLDVRELEPGSYTVTLQLEGYVEKEVSLEVSFNEVATGEWNLRPAFVSLEITSDPNRSDYRVLRDDTEEVVSEGRTPATIEELDSQFTYRVIVERARYESYETRFVPGMEKENSVHGELTREEREEAVASAAPPAPPAPTTRRDQGSSRTTAPATTTTTRTERSPQPETTQRPPPPEPEPERTAPAPARTGTLSVASRPAARVYINDRDTGRYTPIVDYELPVGTHKVVLVNEEFNLNKTYYVDIEPGQSERVINR